VFERKGHARFVGTIAEERTPFTFAIYDVRFTRGFEREGPSLGWRVVTADVRRRKSTPVGDEPAFVIGSEGRVVNRKSYIVGWRLTSDEPSITLRTRE
jgi:hypothetical protein